MLIMRTVISFTLTQLINTKSGYENIFGLTAKMV